LFYNELNFDIPTAIFGDCHARYQVRVAEMRESIKMILQAIEQIPGGSAEKPQNEKS
jgi:NADH:ubiquinone oxidoreductase subunit D